VKEAGQPHYTRKIADAAIGLEERCQLLLGDFEELQGAIIR